MKQCTGGPSHDALHCIPRSRSTGKVSQPSFCRRWHPPVRQLCTIGGQLHADYLPIVRAGSDEAMLAREGADDDIMQGRGDGPRPS